MSRTHRDQRCYYVYKHHHKVCTKWTSVREGHYWPRIEGWCICDTWHDYHRYYAPPPSWWNKGIRRAERAFARNRLQRARAGHRDWSTVDERRGDEYYW